MYQRSREYLGDKGNSETYRSRLGPQFQADIPALCDFKDDVCDSRVDELQWDPEALPEVEVADYLKLVKLARKRGVDEEVGLSLLHQCEYNKEKALKLLSQFRNFDMIWSEDECRRFEDGLERYGKDFCSVQKLVHTKTVKDVVKLYYVWKKSERHDVFVNKRQFLGRSRFTANVKRKCYRCIEYGDMFLEEDALNLKIET